MLTERNTLEEEKKNYKQKFIANAREVSENACGFHPWYWCFVGLVSELT